MTDQDGLFPLGRPITPIRDLTDRQARIYRIVCESSGGLDPIELGQLMHAADGRHSAEDFCSWCGQDGARALREKAIRARVIRRATGIYEPRDHADWTGRAELGVPPPPSAQMRELTGTTWQDAFHPKGEAA